MLLEDLGTQTLEVMALENDVDLPAFYLGRPKRSSHLHGACAPIFCPDDSDVMAIENEPVSGLVSARSGHRN